MAKLSDISNRAIRELFAAYSMGRSTLAADAAATYSTVQSPAASLHVCINGVPKLAADVTNKVMATLAALQNPITGQDGYYVQPVSTTVYYLVVVNFALTYYAIQGTYLGQAQTAFKTIAGTGDIPDIAVPELYAPLGCLKVVTDSTHTFTPATTAFNAAGITTTAVSLNRLPLNGTIPTFA